MQNEIDFVDYAMRAGYPGDSGDIVCAFKSGSSLHGTFVEGKSDFDVDGVFVEGPERVLGLHKIDHFKTSTKPDNVKNDSDDEDVSFHSLRHWAFLARGGNPTVIAAAFAPVGIEDTVWTRHIIPNRSMFMSSGHTSAYLGYAKRQFDRLTGVRGAGKHGQRKDLVEKYGYDVKMGAHLIRLMLEGIELMRTGEIKFPLQFADTLLEIKTGKWSKETVLHNYHHLSEELKQAEIFSALPAKTDLEEISKLVTKCYAEHWRDHHLI